LYWTWRWPYIKAETYSRWIVQIHVLIKYVLYRSCVDLNEHYIKRVNFIDNIIQGLLRLQVIYVPAFICHNTMVLIPLKLIYVDCLASATQLSVLWCIDAHEYGVCPNNKTNQFPNIKITFLHTICHNFDLIRSILIIFKELLNINKAYIKHWRIVKCVTFCV
jgi:hypothetical protein